MHRKWYCRYCGRQIRERRLRSPIRYKYGGTIVGEEKRREEWRGCRLVSSNFYDHFADDEFDVITVHPPAVPYPEGGDWGLSPGMRVATHGGADGSALVVRSIAEARRCLKDGGRLLLLLPHWSNVQRAWDELRKHYTQVTDHSRKQVEFFPIREGKPDEELIQHVRRLAGDGVIEMTFESEITQSWVSVIEGSVEK